MAQRHDRGRRVMGSIRLLRASVLKAARKELPGVTPSRGSPPHPQGAQQKGDQEHANAGE
jgi:hypothetical protein